MHVNNRNGKDTKNSFVAAKYFCYFRLINEIKSKLAFKSKTMNCSTARIKTFETQKAVPKHYVPRS